MRLNNYNKDRFADRRQTASLTDRFTDRLTLSVFCILYSVLFLALTGCGAKKKAMAPQQPNGTAETVVTPEEIVPEEIVPEEPQWHTCLIQPAQVVFTQGEQRISATATMQVVRDSMCIISVYAVLGIEVLRIEATPDGVLGIDKLHGRYARATYDEINARITPQITWEIMQQICSAELPTGSETARLRYRLGRKEAELYIRYPERRTDVPLRMVSARLERYNPVDLNKLL